MQTSLKNIFLSAFLVTVFIGCKTLTQKNQENYEYLQLVHLGDGQIDMRISPGISRSWLTIMVASCDHQPANKQLNIPVTDETSEAFDDFYNAINGRLPLIEPTGSAIKSTRYWQRIHFVQGNHSTEVTNVLLQERFKKFEKVVRETLSAQSTR